MNFMWRLVSNNLIILSLLIIFICALSVALIILVESESKQKELEKIERFEEFKIKTCIEKQSYLLDNDYTQKEKEYYLIECGTQPVGDWGK